MITLNGSRRGYWDRGQYPFLLLCAYPAEPVSCAHHLDALTEVCHVHTQVIGGPPEAG